MTEFATAVLAEYYGPSWKQISQFASLLRSEGEVRGLIGPREQDRLWSRHLLNCAGLGELVPGDATMVDVGSGGGFPGVVIALMRPDVSITLLEPMQRRVEWLEYVKAKCSIENVTVFRGRAEECDRTYDIVTARAVAALDKLLRWCAPLLAPNGEILAIKGQSVDKELPAGRNAARRLGLTMPEVLHVATVATVPPTTVVRVRHL